jgi:hypothetical protein
LTSEENRILGIEVTDIGPELHDIAVSGPGSPTLMISISERHGSARVIADDYVFEPVPSDQLAELIVSLLIGRGRATVRRFPPPFRSVSLAVPSGRKTWRASRRYDGSLYEWENLMDSSEGGSDGE